MGNKCSMADRDNEKLNGKKETFRHYNQPYRKKENSYGHQNTLPACSSVRISIRLYTYLRACLIDFQILKRNLVCALYSYGKVNNKMLNSENVRGNKSSKSDAKENRVNKDTYI